MKKIKLTKSENNIIYFVSMINVSLAAFTIFAIAGFACLLHEFMFGFIICSLAMWVVPMLILNYIMGRIK